MMLKKFFLLLFFVFSFSGAQASTSMTPVEREARSMLVKFIDDIKRASGRGVYQSLRESQKTDFSAEKLIYVFLVSAFGEKAVMGLWSKRPVQESDIVLHDEEFIREEFIPVLVSGGYLNDLSEDEVQRGILTYCVKNPEHALVFILASGIMLGKEPAYCLFSSWDMHSKHDPRKLYAPSYSAIAEELFGMATHNWREVVVKSYKSLSKSYEKKRKKVVEDRKKYLYVLDALERILGDDQTGSAGGQRRRSHSLSLVDTDGVAFLSEDEL